MTRARLYHSILPLQTAARTVRTVVFICLVAVGVPGCSDADNQAFLKSHDSIHAGMTLREAFEAGLADYMTSMGGKNVPGATLPDKQPVSGTCARYVLDVSFSDVFRVRVYCGMNSPSAPQLIPGKTFKDEPVFLQALDEEYSRWSRNMEFLVESPPRQAFGVYDYYRFTIGQEGRVSEISPVILSLPKR